MEFPEANLDCDWKSTQYRQTMVARIEEAKKKGGTAYTKSSNDMENDAFVKAKSQEEYLTLMARVITHIRDCHKKAPSGPVGGAGQMQQQQNALQQQNQEQQAQNHQQQNQPSAGSSLRVHALRVGPGQELLGALLAFVEDRGLRAPFIITCVGSVTTATLRLANATAENTNEVIHLHERFEIVSLVGTLNKEAHLHICLADKEGKTIGGHVLGDLQVFTTAEVVIGEAAELQFTREMDERTGFPELVVRPRSQKD